MWALPGQTWLSLPAPGQPSKRQKHHKNDLVASAKRNRYKLVPSTKPQPKRAMPRSQSGSRAANCGSGQTVAQGKHTGTGSGHGCLSQSSCSCWSCGPWAMTANIMAARTVYRNPKHQQRGLQWQSRGRSQHPTQGHRLLMGPAQCGTGWHRARWADRSARRGFGQIFTTMSAELSSTSTSQWRN